MGVLTVEVIGNFSLNNWGGEYVQNRALGYIPPVAPPITRPLAGPTYVPAINGGVLREVIDFHADQAQMTLASRSTGGISVSAPENMEVRASKGNSESSSGDKVSGSNICSVDQYGDTKCEED